MKKLKLLLIISTLSLLVISFNTQIIQGIDLKRRSDFNISNKSEVFERRGKILDRTGKVLAESIPIYKIYFKSGITEDEETLTLQKLKTITGKDISSTAIKLDEPLDILSEAQYKKVEKDEIRSYLNFKLEFQRKYYYPEQTAHLTGYLSYDSQDSYKTGVYKIEKDYDGTLKSEGTESLGINNSKIKYISYNIQNIQTTVDIDWQIALYKILAKYSDIQNDGGAAGVIIDTQTGEILAADSFPGFDTNVITNGADSNYLAELNNSRKLPLIDKTMALPSTPGSIFKIISSLNLFNKNVINQDSTYFSNQCMQIGSYQLCEFGRNYYGLVNEVSALYKSSNLFFCNYTLEYSKNFNMQEFSNFAKTIGVGRKTDVNISGEQSGNIDSPEYKSSVTNGEQWFDGDTCNLAIGQGATLVTPLQMANIVATLWNDGTTTKPRIVSQILDDNGRVTYTYGQEKTKSFEIDPQSKDLILQGMGGVAYNPQSSTYWFLSSLPNNVRAKTGSAEAVEKINDQYVPQVHGWIVGLFDYNGRTYSFAFFQNYGGGGYYTAQVLRDFLNCLNSNFESHECK